MRQSANILGTSVERFNGLELENAMRHYAPAIFTEEPSAKVSDKYTFLNTMDVVKNMENMGWTVSHVSSKGKDIHGQHMVRFYHKDLQTRIQGTDAMRPQVVFINSHDGTMRAKFNVGLFRLVCTNGLVVGEKGAHDSFSLKHIYNDPSTFMELTQQLHEKYARIFPTISDMQERVLTREEQEVLAYIALTLRDSKYLKEDKITPDFDKINSLHSIQGILRPTRAEDANPTLWNTFNNLQEKLIKGNFYKYREAGKQNRQPRAITDAKRNIDFNAKLWTASNALLVGEDVRTVATEILI